MKKNITLSFLVIALLSFSVSSFAKDYNIKDFGAVSDKSVNSTKAIQNAILECGKNGGGTVVFPAGEYLSGSVSLEDNVILHLEAGATWFGSTDTSLYPVRIPEYVSLRMEATSLIYAEKKTNIGITGFGTINGQGEKAPFQVTWSNQDAPVKRPKVLSLIECSDIHLSDVRILNSPKWTLSFLACDRIKINGISISTKYSSVNNDGIDLDGCKDVTVSNCIIESEDDAIVLKSTSPRSTENVTITNCVLSSHCNAFKCGTETNGGFKNVVISNCIIRDTYLSGIALEIVDGGTMDGIQISNITMDRVNNPLFIKLGDRARKYKKDMPRPAIGAVRNITISNVIANNVGGFIEEPEIEFSHYNAKPKTSVCQISGLPEHYIENVILRDIRVSYLGEGTKEDRNIVVPEKANTYPEYGAYGPLPAFGMFCRHVKNLTLENIDFSTRNEDLRYACVFDDLKVGYIRNIRCKNQGDKDGILKFAKSEKVNLQLHHPMDSKTSVLVDEASNDISYK